MILEQKTQNSIKPAPTKLSAKGIHSDSNSKLIALRKHPTPSINKVFIQKNISIKPAPIKLSA